MISLKFALKGPINNIPALVQIIALSEPVMVNLLMQIRIIRPQWVNTTRPRDTYVNQVMIGSGENILLVLRQALPKSKLINFSIRPIRTKFNEIWIKVKIFSLKKKVFKDSVCQMAAILFRFQSIKCLHWKGSLVASNTKVWQQTLQTQHTRDTHLNSQ